MPITRPEFVNDTSELEAEFDAAAVEHILHRPIHLTDEEQYANQIVAAAIHPHKQQIAYVEYRSKTINNWFDDHYTLKINVEGQTVLNWTLETYNPAMGCVIGFLVWYDDRLVIIYTENHAIYAGLFAIAGDHRLVRIGSPGFPWSVYNNTLACRHIGESHVRRWSIPALESLPDLTQEEAITAGILR